VSAVTTDHEQALFGHKKGEAVMTEKDRGIWKQLYHDISQYSVPRKSVCKILPWL
jgi:hypothetical protein